MAEQKAEAKAEEVCAAVTGANRGLGLEFVNQLLARKYSVIAFCRTPDKATDLSELKKQYKEKLSIVALDHTNDEQIKNLVDSVGGKQKCIDILIVNAGVWGDDITREELVKVFSINCAGPLLIGQALYDNVKQSKRKQMIALSSGLGSVAGVGSAWKWFPAVPYRISKAALQMAWQHFDQHSKANKHGIRANLIAPGWVKTDLHPGNHANAPQTAQDSVKDMLKVICDDYEKLEGGAFYNHDGKKIDW
eukprot:CAMPEP_0197020680 /NCGR_PEP_ID=MMETSP1384-20130603/1529_1 /TAXON_ID=29189 /ORGANISM="Ammonia sp." /LENGTH=248 /DNA_ID=CAMNT_0042448357 /DNA_START=155 /DNA_END=898 /DNA_ORIENTATION=+